MTKTQTGASAWLTHLLAARGKRVIVWLAAVIAAWALNVTLAVSGITPPEYHGVTDMATGVLTTVTAVWLLFAHYWDKYMAAQAARSDEEEKERYKVAERTAVQVMLALHGEDSILGQRPDWLRAV